MTDQVQQVPEVPEDAWQALHRANPPAVTLADGSVLAVAGRWAMGKREHGYAHLEVAGLDPRDAAQRGLAVQVLQVSGDEVAAVLASADPRWDGEWRVQVKRSFAVIYLIKPGVPAKLRYGTTYYTSLGRPDGRSRTYYYGGVTSPQAYAAAVRRLQAELAARSQETRKQAAVDEDRWVPSAPVPGDI